MFEKLLPNASASMNMQTFEQQSKLATELGFTPDLHSTIYRHAMSHEVNILNLCGYCPVVSTVTGSYRAVVGLAYFIKSLACCIFHSSKRAHHVEGIKIAAANIGRGMLEAIPVIGNIFAANIDISRMMHRWSCFTDEDGDQKSYVRGTPFEGLTNLDMLALIPVVGTVVSLSRSIFFAAHALVNVPPALSGDTRYVRAIKFGLSEVAYGIIGSIPISGGLALMVLKYVNQF